MPEQEVGQDVPATKIILLDLDSTIMDVSGRGVAALKDIGVQATPKDWSEKVKGLKSRDKSRFFEIFQSDKYTHLDEPNEHVIRFIRKLMAQERLPAVVLTGRLESMESTLDVIKFLRDRGVEPYDVIRRPERLKKLPGRQFKVMMLRDRGYIPAIVLDDEPKILDAIASEWPDAVLYLATDGTLSRYQPTGEVPESVESLIQQLSAV